MKIGKFLFNLRREKNISITVENGQLSVLGARQFLDEELINQIKSRKQEILSYLESQKEHNNISIPSSDTKEKYVLSSAQKRVYFEKALDKYSIAYNIPTIVKLKGKLDINKFEKTFRQIIQRHEILRTSFEAERGQLYQRIHQEVDFKIHFSKTTEDIHSLIENFVQPFDLGKTPLMRIGLFEIAQEEYLLILDIHHIITDGTSNNLLIREFVDLYNDIQLDTPKLQYRDYAEWQHSRAHDKIISHHALFWSNEYAELPEVLELPLDHPRSAVKKARAGAVNIVIDKELTEGMKKMAEGLGATLYSVLMSTYYILLSRVSGQQDIVIGTVTTGRFTEELESVPGMFVNTVPLRNFPKGELTYKEFLQNVQHNIVSCFDNQMYQFENLVSDLSIKREAGRNPLFDVFFAYQNYNQHVLEIPGLSVEPVGEGLIKTVFDMELSAVEMQDGILVNFIYNANLFKEETIARYGIYFQNIIAEITADLNIRLSEIDILPHEEKQRLIYEFNNTTTDYSKEKTIIDLFEEQVRKAPDNIATRYVDSITTYEELSKKSNQIASYLQQVEEVKVGDMVGLLLEREEEIIPCIFGIIKSGGVYVPLSPSHPSARVNGIIADSNIKVLITRQRYIDALDINLKPRIIDLDTSLERINEQHEIRVNCPGPNDLAYVIYTSGSTGTPKGVMIEHHSIVNRLEWMQKKYQLTAKDVLLQKTPLVFDVSIWELFWWSFTGASLAILPPDEEKDPNKIIQAINDYKVSTIHFVPSMLSAFLVVAAKEDTGQLQTLRQVFSSGEALTADQVNRFGNILNGKYQSKLINLYGPTEATVDVSYFNCDFSQETGHIPIGKPIDNTQLYVLDSYGRLSPMCGIGELCIGGVGLARGYLNNEDLTNEKFVSNTLTGVGKIYKTGDLASWQPDGNIRFYGRKDDQVKIRGYRIELGEVANQLLQHDLIQEAVVMLKEGRYLAAYYMAEKEVDKERLRNHLLRTLPDYMVPQYYIFMETMPLTDNGKLNRKALSQHELVLQNEYVAPRDEFEEQMAKIWADVLEISKIGIIDNYFGLGGDSIKAIKLIYEINEQLECNLKLADLYTNNTIEALSNLVRDNNDIDQEASDLAKKEIEAFREAYKRQNEIPDIYEDIYPMSGIEKGMLFYTLLKDENEQRFDNIIYHEQNYYRIPYSDFDQDIFRKALNLMIRKHDALRKVYDTGSFAHIILKEIDPEVNFIDISHLNKSQQEDYFIEKINTERLKASGKSKELLWRMNVLKIADDFRYLIFDMHHSLLDGWSLHAFLTELNNTYFKLKENINYAPDKLECTYHDHIFGELMDKNNRESIDFWREELKEYKRFQLWKRDEEHRFITRYFPINTEIDNGIQSLASDLKVGVKELFFGAYAYTMGLFSADDNFVVGLTTHNRPLVKDGDKLLGCFLNHIPVNVHLPAEGTWRDYIVDMVNRNRKAKAHERVPFYKIRQLTDEPLRDGVNPIFDVAFTYIDFWVTDSMFEPTENISDESPNFWHDSNDVNQNTLFDIFVKRIFGQHHVIAEYSTTVMDDEMINKFFKYFTNVLSRFIHHLDEPINRDEILEENEKRCLLEYFNDNSVDYPKEQTVIELFEEQVKNNPDHIAIISGNKCMTYAEFNARVDALAAYLVNHGVTEKSVIGIMCDRSFELLTAMFAVMKAGGTYLPIDPAFPSKRKDYILSDSGATLLITQTAHLATVSDIELIDISSLSLLDSTPFKSRAKSQNLAYMIYTSGSTGKPKGVMISHSAVNNFCKGISDLISFSGKRIISVTTASFDIFVLETLLPLQQGATVVLADENEQRDPAALNRAIVRHKVNMIQSTPSLMKVVVESSETDEGLKQLTDIMVGGEVFSDSLLKLLSEKSSARIFNMYGPTETTVWSTVKELTNQHQITIGKPIANTQIYILNRQNKLLPIGVVGELCISGDGLAIGYHNREDLTTERFIEHPYKTGERLYKTGDLARWLPDGNIEYLGRIDHQVKIRGFRIELGEIETQFSSCPDVREAVVLVKGGETDKKLVGYFVSDNNIEVDTFHDHLSKYLPDYMIPSLYVRLDRLPLTQAGKVDRRALPEPDFIVGADYVAPSGDIEEKLTKIWSKVLNLNPEKISSDKSFFEFGGHSLNMVTLINEIFKTFNVQITLKEIFDRPSIQHQAELIEVINQVQSENIDDLDLTEVSI
ncbi:Long-chain-fatty-acid--CoA ligase [Fulvivirga imtechensis AK7]|uniref:Long-chain-fatty-acid--CoA ligase n=1 Tax=Fulvivirga imtechensis AK7 TaxID=1237149 RepID=L8JL26_9BACT|nr:non-ribosomal peptide synthetase [Fulvivirga imtechensis]ELR68117.1 Long-chain-fatty-acid--CoA ligase [Fulvivirga imtechensis AK7]